MDFGNLSSYKENYEVIQENDIKRVPVSDQILNMKSDSFTVDMEPFSHLTNKDLTLNSRINLQRSLPRKGSQIGAEKNIMKSHNERDATFSPRASTEQEKSKLVSMGTTSDTANSQVHHQITIMTGGVATNVKRASSFKQSSIINPRRILFFFATLSSMGTILLIFFILSTAKYDGDDNSLD